ncbi:glycosyltransferase domain-containing protein [Aeoliella sp.]|uniref:glycosyltransferase domain-containing protein n=1 Tax=Aeoliella sp. TaxID=2795800 RepID=UPI003CCC419D
MPPRTDGDSPQGDSLDFSRIESRGSKKPVTTLHFNGLRTCKRATYVESNQRYWNWVIRYAEQKVRASQDWFQDVTIVTWNNRAVPCLLERFAAHACIPITVLGRELSVWQNAYKLLTTFDYLRSCPTRYVLCLDGDDCLLLNSPQSAIRLLHEKGSAILFGAVPTMHPRSLSIQKDFEAGTAPRDAPAKYLNSGQCIIDVQEGRDLFEEALHTPGLHSNSCDQDRWHQLLVRYPTTIQLDYYGDVFVVCNAWTDCRNLLAFRRDLNLDSTSAGVD